MKNIKYIFIAIFGLFFANEIYSQCPSGSATISYINILNPNGTAASFPLSGSTSYKIKVTLSGAPGGSVNIIKLTFADGVGTPDGTFQYIPPAALGVDMGGSESAPVYFNVRTVPTADLGSHMYLSIRYGCTGGTQGSVKQFYEPITN